MRRFIATMQMSIDAKIEGPDGYAALFETIAHRHWLRLRRSEALTGGRISQTYEVDPSRALTAA